MSQHPKSQTPTDRNLKSNPGIGQTTRGIDQERSTFEDEEGESTLEGDVMNDTNRDGSISPNHRGRTND